MKDKVRKCVARLALTGLALSGLSAICSAVSWAEAEAAPGAVPKVVVPYPDTLPGIVYQGPGMTGVTKHGRGGGSKVSPDLQRLYLQYRRSRGAAPIPAYSPSQLESRYGIAGQDKDPTVGLAIKLVPGADPKALAAVGASVHFRIGSTVYASAPVSALAGLAGSDSVAAIMPTKAAAFPTSPTARGRMKIALPGPARGADALPLAFGHAGLTGKGVIVGIVDSGIAWKHPDFCKPDGTTRILSLWDMTDNSWTSSAGKIGSKPPAEAGGKPLGTLYTQAQINDALKGKAQVASEDLAGHGTACAGTAAGNGRATGAGVPAGTYAGVAPEADLVIVRAGTGDGVLGVYYLGTRWIAQTAKALDKPCVISQSFGSQDSPHDGSSEEEAVMNDIAGAGKPGVVICAAAGNEGRQSFHAGGRFGPKQEGQGDIQSSATELFVTKDTELDAYFSDADAWGLAVVGLDNFLVDASGHPDSLFLYHAGGKVEGKLNKPAVKPADFAAFFDTVGVTQAHAGKEDRVAVPLPVGKYLVLGFGYGASVPDGAFDLYLPFSGDASFDSGTDKRAMVASPGNAENVVTVGAYDFRSAWANEDGKQSTYNLVLGDLADYSSPGFRRGGGVKPDLSAPATYMISPLAPGSAIGLDKDKRPDMAHITADGFHVAWSGTSAATPYVAGVIALMLQKNPALDAAQIKDILIKSATHDAFTGAVPNVHWGWGKIAPAAALAATPLK